MIVTICMYIFININIMIDPKRFDLDLVFIGPIKNQTWTVLERVSIRFERGLDSGKFN